MAKYYEASGKFDYKSFLYFILTSITILPLLGLVYAYCIWYIPFIYINFIIAAVLGFIISWFTRKIVIKLGKVRNTTLALIFGLLAGLICMYFHWAVWVDLVINAEENYGNSTIGITVSNIKILDVFALALQPDTLFSIIQEINKYGTWGLRSATVSGVFLSIIWIIELLIIVGISTIIPIATAKEPFCELDNKWFKEHILPAFNYVENRPEFLANLEQSNPETFSELKKVENLERNHSVFTLYKSEKGDNYLSVQTRRAKKNKKDEIEFNEIDVAEYIHLNTELVKLLPDLAKQ